MKIILLRHGKPDMPVFGRLKACEMYKWIECYNSVGIDQTVIPPARATEMAANCMAIACSDMPRSVASADALKAKEGHVHLSDSIFREIALPYANWNSLRLRPAIWVALFRLLWFLGFSPRCESYHSARLRAMTGARRLKELAAEHGSVLLAGHGLLNRFLAKELLATGWQGPASPGKQYWEFGVYEYRGTQQPTPNPAPPSHS
jgi:broad specificity phosphatase PhoE